MIKQRTNAILIAIAAFLLSYQTACAGDGKAAKKETQTPYGEWSDYRDDGDSQTTTMRLKVYPKAASFPVLKHRLIPHPAQRVEGNSALFYLKAMGFPEQRNSLQWLTDKEEEWRKEAAEKGEPDYPPGIWYNTPPDELPLEEVREYLDVLSFQEKLLYTAARRKNYSQDRAMEREENPIGYLLMEVQQMRGLARNQIVRLRFAIAEKRIDDAVEILSQMITMANQLGDDKFLVSGLVAIAIENIANDEGISFSQHPDAPNLYWAITACPRPVVDLTNAVEYESQLLFQQFPMLKEVNENARSKNFWAEFGAQIVPKWNKFATTMNEWDSIGAFPDNLDQFQLALLISTHYEPAREFLHEVAGISDSQLDEYPPAQVCFLAMKKYWEALSDETSLNFYQMYSLHQNWQYDSPLDSWRDKLGWISEVSETLGAAGETIAHANARAQQRMAMWQIVEAIRMTAAANGGVAPKSLDHCVVPTLFDPARDEPFEYSADGQTATITGDEINGIQWQLVVEIAKDEKPASDAKTVEPQAKENQ